MTSNSFSLEEENQLMLQVAEGSDTATRKLVAQYLNYVISLAFRVVGNRHDAEEISQEVFLKLFKQAEKWESRARISTWLYRVTYNLSIDCIRSSKRHATYELKEFSAKELTEEDGFQLEDLECLEKAMSRLSDKHRAALTVFYFQNKKIREAAEIMSLKEDAFESLLRRARKKLKEILQGLQGNSTYGGKNEVQKNSETNVYRTSGTDDYQIPLLSK